MLMMVISVFPVSRSAIGTGRVVVTPGSLGWESNFYHYTSRDGEMGTFLLVVEADFEFSRLYVGIFRQHYSGTIENLRLSFHGLDSTA